MRRLSFVLRYAFLALATSAAWGQEADLSGLVRDSSGAVVPNAAVKAVRKDAGTSRTARTNQDGYYSVQYLQPGVYEVDVSADGFKKITRSDLKLEVDQHARLDFTLEVGLISEHVTVTADQTPLLQTEDVSVGAVVQSEQVESLPLNGRNFTQLLELSPGTVPSTETPRFTNADPQLAGNQRNGMPAFDVNGQTGGVTAFRIDGADNSERQFGGATIPISVDAIQEFKLQTSNFSAEYGRSPAQVDVVTKSGTNQIHGTLFEFLRNEALDATQWAFTGAHQSSNLRRNQFGGSVGGPIRKDRMFFFFNYEGMRQIFSSPRVMTLPSDDMRKGVFPSGVIIFDPLSQLPFPNNTIPSQRFNPITQKALSVLPAPNLPGQQNKNAAGLFLDPINNCSLNPRRVQNINQYNGRIDYTISEKDNIAVRYTDSANFLVNEAQLASALQSIVGSERDNLGGQNLSVAWYHNVNASTINEARFGFQNDPQDYANGDTTDYAAQFGLKQFLEPNSFPGLPHFTIGSINLGSGNYRPLQVTEHSYQFTDNLTMVRGAHSIRVGGDVRLAHLITANSQLSKGLFNFNGAQTRDRSTPTTASTKCPGTSLTCTAGDAMADFLLGYPNQTQKGSAIQPIGRSFSNWAGFINDTWHIQRRLTLTLGLRYEINTRFHSDVPFYSMAILKNGDFTGKVAVANDSKGNMSPLVVASAAALAPGSLVTCRTVGLPDECLINQKNLWQPRLGFAWNAGNRTVLRGGAGIFYSYLYGDGDTEEGENWPLVAFVATTSYTAPPTGTALPPLTMSNPFSGANPAAPSFTQSGDPSRKIPSTYQWNLTVERALPGNMGVSVGYVGSASRHLEALTGFYNLPQPIGVVLAKGQSQVRADPAFADISVWEDRNVASYNSLQTKFSRRMSHGLSVTGAYTWSKNIAVNDWLSDPRNSKSDRGPWSNDLRHNLVVSGVWQVPVGSGRRFLNVKGVRNQVLGGWQLGSMARVRTGFPFTPTVSIALLNDSSHVTQNRPDRLCNGTISDPTVFNWFDKKCFAFPVEPTTPGAELRQGNSGYDILRGPGAFSMDSNLSKTFPLRERIRLDFRAEFFNILNHPMFAMPAAVIAQNGNNTPAQITATTSLPRIVQFALKLRF